MALTRYSLYAPAIIHNHQSASSGKRPKCGLVMCAASNPISVNLQIRPSCKNKVFEDRSAGIVCYRDENGEITCEGYDEGPRFHQQMTRFTCNSRDLEIVDLLQRCWLQVADDDKAISTDQGFAGYKDVNCNGLNTHY